MDTLQSECSPSRGKKTILNASVTLQLFKGKLQPPTFTNLWHSSRDTCWAKGQGQMELSERDPRLTTDNGQRRQRKPGIQGQGVQMRGFFGKEKLQMFGVQLDSVKLGMGLPMYEKGE